ncbi:MAG: nitrogen fixation protein NifM [Thiotrichales bacterium]
MTAVSANKSCPPGFNYHLLRSALETYKKNTASLAPAEQRVVAEKAKKTFDLESLVIASPEASDILIAQSQINASFDEIASRYESEEAFIQDLDDNGLNEEGLKYALHRELIFDATLQRVASNSPEVSDIDVHLFYEMNHDRFEEPEQRTVSHILITINEDYAENRREAALDRIEEIRNKLGTRHNRFADFAKRNSECPTAMDGGKMGVVKRGQLYAELDAALFSMEENQISDVIESELGFHLLLCEKIKPGKRIPLTRVADRIRDTLIARRQRNCQKAWIASLVPNQNDISAA